MAGNHLNLLLGRRYGSGYGGFGAGLKGVGVKARGGFGNTGTVFLHFVHVGQHRHSGTAKEVGFKRRHHARRALADNCADFVVQHVVDIDLAVHNGGARVDGLRQGIKHTPHEVGLNLLDVHNRFGHGVAKEQMRFWVGAKNGKRCLVGRLVHHHVVGTAHRADAAQFGNTIAVIVVTDPRFDVKDALDDVGVVGAVLVGTGKELVVVVQFVAAGGVALNHFGVVAHGNQFGNGLHRTVANQLGVVNGTRAPVNDKFFRRDSANDNAVGGGLAVDPNVKQLRYLDRRSGPRHGVNGRLNRSHALGFRVVILSQHFDFDAFFVVQGGQFILAKARIFRRTDRNGVVPIPLQDAGLADKGVLESRRKDGKAVIVRFDHISGVIGGLFGKRDVFRAIWGIFDHIVGRKEYPHQARKHGVYGVADVPADHLTAAVHLVAEQVALVVFRGQSPSRRDFLVDKVFTIVNQRTDKRLKFLVGTVFRLVFLDHSYRRHVDVNEVIERIRCGHEATPLKDIWGNYSTVLQIVKKNPAKRGQGAVTR